jgi:arylsulfatase A-like enzyme
MLLVRRVRSSIGRWGKRAWTTLAAAVIGGFAVGLLESTAMALVAEPTGSASRAITAWAVGAALTALGAIPVLFLVLTLLAALARLRLVRDWWQAARGGGPDRAVLVWRAILLAAATLALGALSLRLVAWTYQNYPDREPALFASFIAVAVMILAATIGFAAAAIDRRLAPWIASAGWPVRAVSGRPLLVGLIGLAIASIAVPETLIGIALPSMHPLVAFGACTLPVLLVALRSSRIDERPRAQLVAAGLLVAIAGGLALVPGSDGGRGRVVARGMLSRSTFVTLSHMPFADRDRDGFPRGFFGGSDCDDSRPKWNPRGIEVAGNGIDENCTGGDADPAWPAARLKPQPTTRAGAPRHNILVVSIDSLRADHVGAWGYSRATTPAIDRLAARGTRFAWAFTSTPTTRPAIASLLTGRLPSTLPWVRRVKLVWEEAGAVGLPEVLRGAGYDTAAVACCDRFETAVQEYAGLKFIDRTPVPFQKIRPGRSNGDLVADRAIAWLEKRSGRSDPFFLWMHFIDPHSPYVVHEGGTSFGKETIDRYDAELAFVDRQVGRILAAVDELGLSSSTIVVVTADHGEEFEEHGIKFHSLSLFNQVARIPLVVAYPGAAPRVVSAPVSIADIMPTVLDLVGIDGPGGMNGRSLASAVHEGKLADRPVLLEVFPQKSIPRDLLGVVYQTWKLVWDREANTWSLFSLADDPDDRNDLADEQPDRLAEMKRLLRETTDRELARPRGAKPR